jgi:AhpD family alkylhydroperoxidase
MPFFASLPDDAGVRHILALNPKAGRALIEFHEAALRNASPLPVRDKELIAAYVSALNACQYCYGVHSETAKAFGVDDEKYSAGSRRTWRRRRSTRSSSRSWRLPAS